MEKNLADEKKQITQDIKKLSVSMNLDARLSEPDYEIISDRIFDIRKEMESSLFPEGYFFEPLHHQECLLETKSVAQDKRFAEVQDCKQDKQNEVLFGMPIKGVLLGGGFYLLLPFAHAAARRRRETEVIEAPQTEAAPVPPPVPEKRKSPTLNL